MSTARPHAISLQIARETRELMAQLGFRKFDDMVGRSDLLDTNKAVTFWKAKGLDFSAVFHRVDAQPDECRFTAPQPSPISGALDYELLPQLEGAGLKVSGRSADGALVEVVEAPDHPWFVACQFHPEFTSTPRDGHPLFSGFVKAALKQAGKA